MATARKLPSGSWRVRVYDNETKSYKSFTAATKKEAERMGAVWLVEREEELKREALLTFKKAANEYIEARKVTLSPTTIAGYETIVRNNTERFNDIAMTDITAQSVQDWVNELTVSKSDKSVYNIYGFFKSVLNYHDIELNLKKVALPPKEKHFKTLPKAETVINIFKDAEVELPVLLAV